MSESPILKPRYFGNSKDAPPWCGRLVNQIGPLMNCLGMPCDWAWGRDSPDESLTIFCWVPLFSTEENPGDYDLVDIETIEVSGIQELFESAYVLLQRGRLSFEGSFEGHEVTLILVHFPDPDTIDDIPDLWPWMTPIVACMLACLGEPGEPEPNSTLLN
jgi:hypothetical protein